MVVHLQCIQEASKLRVKITCYINHEGKKFYGIYNNNLNCRFPRDLRVEGRIFEVPDEDVTLLGGNGKAYYYSVKKNNLKIIENGNHNIEQIYHVSTECIVCMENDVKIVFNNCGHYCCCVTCAKKLKSCCVCRSKIISLVNSDDLDI